MPITSPNFNQSSKLCDKRLCHNSTMSLPDENVWCSHLRQHVIDVWVGVEQSINVDAIDQWHRRIRARRGHYEYSWWHKLVGTLLTIINVMHEPDNFQSCRQARQLLQNSNTKFVKYAVRLSQKDMKGIKLLQKDRFLITALTDYMQFMNTKVSQGSVATCLRCDEIFNHHRLIANLLLLSEDERILKIDQHLAKLLAKSSIVFSLNWCGIMHAV